LQKNGAVAYAALDEPLLLARERCRGGLATVPTEAPAPAPAFVAPSVPPLATPVPHSLPAETTLPVPIAVAPRQVQPVRPSALAADAAAIRAGAVRDCAVVESVRPVEVAPRGGVIGAIGGAIAGAILGKQAGEAHQQRMLTLLGAIGGGLAGRQIERQATQSTQYDVDLRLADGSVLRRRYEQAPPFVAGATIRLGTASRATPVPGL
jgi:outer membrane lipoprotein SlyB